MRRTNERNVPVKVDPPPASVRTPVNGHRRRRTLILLLCTIAGGAAFAQIPENVGDTPDGNRSVPLHLIKLYDEFDHVIRLDDRPLMPFSPKQTCRKCHDYEKIRRGWHFNAADSGVPGGRQGEPWILVDPGAATQVPLSYRSWAGTYRPADIGLSSLAFLKTFGRHLPGGGVGEKDGELNDYMRWQVSGPLEVNCQSCHNADPGQSQSEYGMQVMRQNFRWAATAGSGFAVVRGSAGEMPDNYDTYSAVPPESSNLLPPTVTYNASRMDGSGRVLFNVPRRMPPAQCAFCHSSRVVDPARPERWEREEDVHIAAGMLCVDCHRNGIDHQMIRGYEGEAEQVGRPRVASFTCRGCHLGGSDEPVPLNGRRGAPRPEHLGIPPVHFERLACTACHSGPWPGAITTTVKTSRGNALGIPKTDKADDALPQIAAPVFIKQADGTYAPHNLLWPAFWAFGRHGTLALIGPGRIRPLATAVLSRDTTRRPGRWPVLRESEILEILQQLRRADSTAGDPLYVSGGTMYAIAPAGTLTRLRSDAAKPYAWPIAHDVRPKGQSLGIRGCTDCHATDAPFHFGMVKIASPYVVRADSLSPMTDYQDTSPVSAWLFAMSFLFRPGLKVVIILCFLFIAFVVLIQGLRGLAYIIRTLAGEEE
jgi:nitrate/TMAO reductase-like tetraheme cytochrome c subunit